MCIHGDTVKILTLLLSVPYDMGLPHLVHFMGTLPYWVDFKLPAISLAFCCIWTYFLLNLGRLIFCVHVAECMNNRSVQDCIDQQYSSKLKSLSLSLVSCQEIQFLRKGWHQLIANLMVIFVGQAEVTNLQELILFGRMFISNTTNQPVNNVPLLSPHERQAEIFCLQMVYPVNNNAYLPRLDPVEMIEIIQKCCKTPNKHIKNNVPVI